MFQPDGTLEEIDPEIFGIIKQEKARQVGLHGCSGLSALSAVLSHASAVRQCRLYGTTAKIGCAQVHGLELIASENFTSKAVRCSRLRFACALRPALEAAVQGLAGACPGADARWSCTRQVMQAVGSCMTNKYSEGLPGARYYGGNQFIDQAERLCQVPFSCPTS